MQRNFRRLISTKISIAAFDLVLLIRKISHFDPFFDRILREIWRLGFSSGRIRTSPLSLSSKETNENRIEMQQRNGKLRVAITAATITARLIVDYSFGRRPTRFHFLFLPFTCPFPILPFKQMTHGVSLTRIEQHFVCFRQLSRSLGDTWDPK